MRQQFVEKCEVIARQDRHDAPGLVDRIGIDQHESLLLAQGLRILIGLELSEEGFEGVVVPAGLLAFASQAA